MAILFFALALTACSAVDSRGTTEATDTFARTLLPIELGDMGVHDEATNSASPTVMLILQGGPHAQLGFARDGRSIFRYLPRYREYDVIYLHQTQTLNPQIMTAGSEFGVASARKEIELSADIISSAVVGYQKKGKRVVVISHSYGSFLALHHIKQAGPIADEYIILAGRLDIDDALVAIHRSGNNARFDDDGVTLLSVEERNPSKSSASANDYRNGNLLKAAAGAPRLSSELRRLDLSNTTFVFASNDEAVGSLNSSEIEALEAAGARVIETHDGHGDTIKRFIDKVKDNSISLITPTR